MGAKKRFYRYQNTPNFETGPSSHLFSRVVVDRPADPEGWEGYWWAWVISPATNLPDFNEDYLIKETDVEAARNGEEVFVYLPGLCGTTSFAALWQYVSEQVGGVDGYVAVYEGKLLRQLWDGVCFIPLKLVAVYPASELPKLAEEELEEDEDE